ncbi:MAG: UDP-N-acetylmuramate--alanine ligase [Prosthecochloris sp.]|nr:UDP-N-acetylmuramate--alanine ligase [Prosthecochloris sp.]
MSSLYFIGIAGTAMASVAVALSKAGHTVAGSDSALYPPMSAYLTEHRIPCHTGFDPLNLLRDAPDVIVVGNAISRGNPELETALNEHLNVVSMPEIVRRELIGKNRSVVITGTHGKTTTTSLTAWLFEHAGLTPGFLIGGIAENFNAGCRASGKKENGYFITEGDEYDTAYFDKRSKFLHYRPDIAVINNIEFDHADIFSSLDDIVKSFRQFIALIPSNGLLIVNGHDTIASEISSQAFCPVERFGMSEAFEWSVSDIDVSETETSFQLAHKGNIAGTIRIDQFGSHTILNTVAAVAAASHAGIPFPVIAEGVRSFKRPKRRMEIVGEFDNGITLIDDFAHHPTAISATLSSLRQRFPERRILACFEPRSNTSTRNIFQKDLENSFSDADIVIIGKVHRPERYAEHERLDTQKLCSSLAGSGKKVFHSGKDPAGYPEDIVRFIHDTIRPDDLIILLSNGSFNGLKTSLTESFLKKG